MCDSVPGRCAGVDLLSRPSIGHSGRQVRPVDFSVNLSQYKIFHYFMHMRAKTICEFTPEFTAEFTSEFTAFFTLGDRGVGVVLDLASGYSYSRSSTVLARRY